MSVGGRLAIVATLVAVAAAAAAAGLSLGRGMVGDPLDVLPALEPGAVGAEWLEIPAPNVAFETPTGDTARLIDYRGQLVLVNFWGSWCPPCLIEIPHLIRVQRTLEGLGGTIVAPAVDSGSGEDVLRFAREHGINYPVWLADYDIAVGEFGAAGYPFTLLVDRGGIIRRRYLGPQTRETLLRDIGALVAGPTDPDHPPHAPVSADKPM